MSGFFTRIIDALRGRMPAPASARPPGESIAATPVAVAPLPSSVAPLASSVASPPTQEPRTTASTDAAKAFAASIRHLPLFSGTATQLVRSAGNEDVSGRHLSRLIATDASLVAHLLRIANSPTVFPTGSRP